MLDLIELDQTGFIRGHQTQNTRRSLHVINQIKENNSEALLVSLDTEIDSVNWTHFYHILERFGLKKDTIQCFKTIYHEPTGRIQVNGHLINEIILRVRDVAPHLRYLPCVYIFI